MSGYAEMARNAERRIWLDRWVPEDDKALESCPKGFSDQYRFTLARAREAERELSDLKTELGTFRRLLERGW